MTHDVLDIVATHCFAVQIRILDSNSPSPLYYLSFHWQPLTDFAFGTKFAPKDDAGLEKKKVAELLNGRLAMIAVGGIATQSIITGHGFPYI